VDHLDVLRRRSFLQAEQVPDTVEQLGAEPSMKLDVVTLAQGRESSSDAFVAAARLAYDQRTMDGRGDAVGLRRLETNTVRRAP
jgi:hypothetical protein